MFRSQSVLFGNALGVHAAVIGKMLFYLVVATWPLLIVGVLYLLNRQRLRVEMRDGVVNGGFIVLFAAAIVPFAFYLLIYFMKAGYLLNVIPSFILLSAVFIDELAIAAAKRRKQVVENRFELTRKFITRHAIALTGVVVVVNILWFTLPLPGKQFALFVDGVTAASFGNDLSDRVKSGSSFDRLLNRAFAYTSSQGVSNVDVINKRIRQVISSRRPGKVVIDTWWSRWSYIYFPEVLIYDVITAGEKLEVGWSIQHDRIPELSKLIKVDEGGEVILLMRPDHPDLEVLSAQATLTPLDAELGIYLIRPQGNEIRWRDRTFRFGER